MMNRSIDFYHVYTDQGLWYASSNALETDAPNQALLQPAASND